MRGDTDAFALNIILACEKAASSDVCIFYTFRATHLPKRQMLVFQGITIPPMIHYPSLPISRQSESDGELSLHTSLCLDVVTCAIVLLVHGGACVIAFRREKKVKTHTKQAP